MLDRAIKAIKNPSLVITRLMMVFHRCEEWFFAVKDSRSLSKKTNTILFVDLGANLGQGYSWFSNHFDGDNIKFELFEPNPYCLAELKQLADVKNGKVKLHGVAVGPKAGNFKFYGLAENEGGKYSEGGSILKTQNSAWYEASSDLAIDVEVIDFSKYLKEKSKNYETILVKMDVEGAEVELLEKMIKDFSIDLIDYLYVEFHSQFLDEESSTLTKRREENIIKELRKKKGFNLRIWH